LKEAEETAPAFTTPRLSPSPAPTPHHSTIAPMLPCTRRQFSTLALSTGLFAGSRSLFAATKPDSKVAGVQIGMNVPYNFGNIGMSGAEVLQACVELGVSAVELRTQPVEAFLGSPAKAAKPAKGEKTPKGEDTAAKLRAWRESVSLDRATEFRKTWNDAGVLIEIVKVDGIFKMSDAELDYVFNLGKALGARALSTEISHSDEELKRVGSFADKHKFPIGYHGHHTTGPADWEKAFSLAKYNFANVDIGHFVAGDFGSPVPFITKHHERITHVHIKDRKKAKGPSVVFGEGDTPIKEVLHLIRDNKWNIQATIEFEYKVPADSTRMAELAKTVKYCREALA
jgi:sugar phosphate isomerase/epimerase